MILQFLFVKSSKTAFGIPNEVVGVGVMDGNVVGVGG